MTPSDQRTGRTFGRVARELERRAMPAVERALTDLAEVEQLVPFLALLRDPQARRPWREVHLDPYACAEADAQAREERTERVEIAPGEHTDAARPDVLDPKDLADPARSRPLAQVKEETR